MQNNQSTIILPFFLPLPKVVPFCCSPFQVQQDCLLEMFWVNTSKGNSQTLDILKTLKSIGRYYQDLGHNNIFENTLEDI